VPVTQQDAEKRILTGKSQMEDGKARADRPDRLQRLFPDLPPA
jgi:hypothetical protein